MAASKLLNPLNWNVPIVGKDGRPTQEFMIKWRQQTAINTLIPSLDTPEAVSLVMDQLYSTPGGILVRGVDLWGGLASPSDTTKFLRGDAMPAWEKVSDADLTLTDILTNNVSITKHGFAPKAPNDASLYLDGTGAWTTPAGGGGGGGTPVIRAHNITPFTASNPMVLTLPTGGQVGDLAMLFIGSAFNVNSATTGSSLWALLAANNVSNWSYAVLAKVLTSADITNGTVSVSLGGSSNLAVGEIVIFDGQPTSRSPLVAQSFPASATTSTITPGLVSPEATDLVCVFASSRGNGTISVPGTTAINTSSTGSGTGGFFTVTGVTGFLTFGVAYGANQAHGEVAIVLTI